MTINLIDARRELHNKCLELFTNKKIAEQIYRNLCDGIEECETVETELKHGHWILKKVYEDVCGNEQFNYICSECGAAAYEFSQPYCHRCGAIMDLIGEDKSHPFAESVMMGMDEVEE